MAIFCHSYGKKVPGPDYGPTPGDEAVIRQAYICPKCGKPAFPKSASPE
jgi:ribosomal protein L37AE/L43A